MFANKTDLLEAMSYLLNYGKANCIITTLGSKGSLLLKKNVDKPSNCKQITSFTDVLLEQKPDTITIYSYHSYQLYHCSPYPIDHIQDTTGAGDTFIGSICFGILHHLEIEKMLHFASMMAAKKIAKTE